MRRIYAKDHGILPGKEVAAELNALLSALASEAGEKTLVFEAGTYILDSDKVPAPTLYVTNTIGDGEWLEGETPHVNKTGMLFCGISDLAVEGNGAVFVYRGRMTNIAVQECINLCLKNITLVTENPDMHALKVIGKGPFRVDFALDGESVYRREKNKFYFVGKDYVSGFGTKSFTSYWIGKIPADNNMEIIRSSHPLRGAITLKELAPGVFRARYFFAPRYREGDEFHIFDVRRKYQGIFVERSKNISFEGIVQRFNYGLANVYQDSENITVKNSVFAPVEGGAKKMASVADFMQVCCCRGEVKIESNTFCGAGDDCLNVHGIHFAVKKVKGRELTLAFRHPQSHGFCPFRQGDRVRFVRADTLLPVAEAVAESAELANEYNIKLTLTEAPSDTVEGTVAENASACPDVIFSGNSLDRIITRGLLITTSGKVRIENNDFRHTSMNAVLISDDAKSWYESGFVRDVVIRNNRFYANKGYYVCVKPENKRHKGYVHSGIRVEDNLFDSPSSEGLYFKSAKDCIVKNNKFGFPGKIKILRSELLTDTEEASR